MITNLPHSAAVFSPFVLRDVHDAWVHGGSNRLGWKVPTRSLTMHFESHSRVRPPGSFGWNWVLARSLPLPHEDVGHHPCGCEPALPRDHRITVRPTL